MTYTPKQPALDGQPMPAVREIGLRILPAHFPGDRALSAAINDQAMRVALSLAALRAARATWREHRTVEHKRRLTDALRDLTTDRIALEQLLARRQE